MGDLAYYKQKRVSIENYIYVSNSFGSGAVHAIYHDSEGRLDHDDIKEFKLIGEFFYLDK